MIIYAYARVSSIDQNLTRQIESFLNFGVNKTNIYSDKKSGKDFERKEYKKLKRKIKKDDLLIIKSIDRLGRNYDSIISEWADITNRIGADILVLDMPLLDTRKKAENLVGKFISDVVLQVLSFVAENERVNIKARQAEGIKLAKERGVKFGRPIKLFSDKNIEIFKKYNNKSISLKDALKITKMTKGCFLHHSKKYID